jgi:hypothetical protein
MKVEISEQENKIREFFGLSSDAILLNDDAILPDVTPQQAAHLKHFNIEWHVIPSEQAVPFDESYLNRLYPRRSLDFAVSYQHHHSQTLRDSLAAAHRRRQGVVVGVETTIKPDYLPGNRQFYGSPYGFEPTADPFFRYLARAGFTTATRFNHNYASLRALDDMINADWRSRDLMPLGFRLTICPPVVFNLVGALFHPEWSETRSLELAAYRDPHGNAVCYAVGSLAPGDFSFVHRIETDSDWKLLGFRAALVPDNNAR